MDIPTVLKEARHASGFRQQDVADIIGVSRGHYANFETGEKVPSAAQAEALAAAFGLPDNQASALRDAAVIAAAGPDAQALITRLQESVVGYRRG